MVTKEQRIELAARLAAHLVNPENEGTTAGKVGAVTSVQVWYLDHNLSVQSAYLFGFFGEGAILTAGGRPFAAPAHEVWTVYEEALCESAERQRERLKETQAAYLATCDAAVKFLAEARKEREKAKRDKEEQAKADQAAAWASRPEVEKARPKTKPNPVE